MNANGSARAGRNAVVGNLSLKTTVFLSGASTLSTIRKWPSRALVMPSGGLTIYCQLAATSAAVSGEPSWNLTPSRILNVQVLPPSVGSGISVHRSHTKSVVEDGLSGFGQIRLL